VGAKKVVLQRYLRLLMSLAGRTCENLSAPCRSVFWFLTARLYKQIQQLFALNLTMVVALK